MKKIFTLFSALSLTAAAFSQSVYMGNAKGGFGGVIGNSTLQISEDATRVYFNLIRGNDNFTDALVIYIDTKAGGFTTTSTFTDNSDQLRNAISGYNGSDRSIVNFASNYDADFAIALSPGSPKFGGLWRLNATGEHTYLENADLTPNDNIANVNYRFSVTKVSLGLIPETNVTFKFVATYLNFNNVFRSNEGYASGLPDNNPAYATVNYTNFLTFPATVLPVKLLSFNGTLGSNKATLTWKVANDDEMRSYDIEKSIDGSKFSSIASIKALRNRSAETYEATDANLNATNYYRLKSVDEKGDVSYSKIVQLSTNTKGKGFSIFPNPVQQTLNIKMATLEKGKYDVNVYGAAGQLVLSRSIQYDGSGNTLQIELPANMTKGSYNCILSNSSNSKFASTFLKQ